MTENPLLKDWSLSQDMPPFSEIKPNHYLEAFHISTKLQEKEFEKIIENDSPPTFENTIIALETSGRELNQLLSVFFNLAGTCSDEKLQEIEREMTPLLAKHNNKMFVNEKLFKKIETLFKQKEQLNLTEEQDRVLERWHTGLLRSGANLEESQRNRISQISQRSAELGTAFSQNLLKDEASYQLFLEDEKDLAGLPDFLIESAARTAKDLGHDGKKVITLSRSSIEPFLQFSERRDLREKAFKAWIKRGASKTETDNTEIIKEILELRSEKAAILGFKNYAEYKLDDSMAKTPENVHDLLNKVWKHARITVEKERSELQRAMHDEGVNENIEPWDWRYYAEKVRKERHDLDESQIKPYFQLENIIAAAFDTANKLFDISFKERRDIKAYHPDVRVWDVKDKNEQLIGRFLGDYFARPSKRGGAWMSSFRVQEKLNDEITPIIVNVLNFVKGAEGEPSLLTADDARTLFHEFGHGLHGLLSDVTFPSLSGTSVSRDFVELPSQLYEHWMFESETLEKYAKHAKTQEPIPQDLLQKLLAARNFNQGFMTIEYLACAILDLKLHEMTINADEKFDILTFEEKALSEIDMPKEVVMRHRMPHFMHLFSGDGYSSGYYSYMWSEVMDSDAFKAFKETGDIFNKSVSDKLKTFIYSSGGKYDPELAYMKFRGQKPSSDALIEDRGLV